MCFSWGHIEYYYYYLFVFVFIFAFVHFRGWTTILGNIQWLIKYKWIKPYSMRNCCSSKRVEYKKGGNKDNRTNIFVQLVWYIYFPFHIKGWLDKNSHFHFLFDCKRRHVLIKYEITYRSSGRHSSDGKSILFSISALCRFIYTNTPLEIIWRDRSIHWQTITLLSTTDPVSSVVLATLRMLKILSCHFSKGRYLFWPFSSKIKGLVPENGEFLM